MSYSKPIVEGIKYTTLTMLSFVICAVITVIILYVTSLLHFGLWYNYEKLSSKAAAERVLGSASRVIITDVELTLEVNTQTCL